MDALIGSRWLLNPTDTRPVFPSMPLSVIVWGCDMVSSALPLLGLCRGNGLYRPLPRTQRWGLF